MFALLVLAVFALGLLVWQNYRLEKRWRALRYCWQTMSDFAGERLREVPANYGDLDEHWKAVVLEQKALMTRFGIQTLNARQYDIYEMALLERNIPRLSEHDVGRVW